MRSADAGVGLTGGDTQKWIPGWYLDTAGWGFSVDNLNVSYTTPRMNGIQVGASYGADTMSENSTTSEPKNNDDSVASAGINYIQDVGEMSFTVSLGHVSESQGAALSYDMDNDAEVDDMSAMTKGFDNRTLTNVGLKVGMGAFTFNVAYATRDDGKYMEECWVGTAAKGTDARRCVPLHALGMPRK